MLLQVHDELYFDGKVTIEQKSRFAHLDLYNLYLQELEQWNKDGRQRMDDLLKPGANLLPEERVMYTMELQSDIEAQIEKRTKHEELWSKVEPKEKAEESEPAQVRGTTEKIKFS